MKTQCQFSIEDAKQLIEQNEIQVWSKFFEYVFFAKTNQDDEPSFPTSERVRTVIFITPIFAS